MAYLIQKTRRISADWTPVSRRCVVAPVCCVEPITICDPPIAVPRELFLTVTGFDNSCFGVQFTDPFFECNPTYANAIQNESYQVDYVDPASPLHDPTLICGLDSGRQWYLTGTQAVVPGSTNWTERGRLVQQFTHSCSSFGSPVTIRGEMYINARLIICCSCDVAPFNTLAVRPQFNTIIKYWPESAPSFISYANTFTVHPSCPETLLATESYACVESVSPLAATVTLPGGITIEVTE